MFYLSSDRIITVSKICSLLIYLPKKSNFLDLLAPASVRPLLIRPYYHTRGLKFRSWYTWYSCWQGYLETSVFPDILVADHSLCYFSAKLRKMQTTLAWLLVKSNNNVDENIVNICVRKVLFINFSMLKHYRINWELDMVHANDSHVQSRFDITIGFARCHLAHLAFKL